MLQRYFLSFRMDHGLRSRLCTSALETDAGLKFNLDTSALYTILIGNIEIIRSQ
jgi:hypothetical protein